MWYGITFGGELSPLRCDFKLVTAGTGEFQPGQKVQVFRYQNRIEIIPIRPMKKARGFLKGIDTSIKREDDRT